MSKSDIGQVCGMVRENLTPLGYKNVDLNLQEKVLLCLKTLGTGSFQTCSKDFIKVSQPTVSRILSSFVDAVVDKAPLHIKMSSSSSEIALVKNEFYQVARFPGVIGCIDGSHIPIIAPSEFEYAYVNRKGFHSINIQGICDANLLFRDVVARWPGSSHDSFILETSGIYEKFEQRLFDDSWLLGKSGYSLKPWLLTPIANPRCAEESKYNNLHRKTQNFIERAFAVLKSRWRISDHTGGSLCYTPEKVRKITVNCCVLHNICRRNGTPILNTQPDPGKPELHVESTNPTPVISHSGLLQRERVVAIIRSQS